MGLRVHLAFFLGVTVVKCLNLFEEKRQTERKTSWLTKCKCGKTPAFFIFLLYIWIFG